MKKDKARAHCPRCRHQQLFVKAKINHALHLALAVMTGGLWLVSWLALCIGKVLRPWRCEHCGWHKPEFVIPAEDQPNGETPVAAGRQFTMRRRRGDPGEGLVGARTSSLRP